jgi:hypothetical protein
MAPLLSYCGWIVAELDGILWSLLGGLVILIVVRRVPPGLVLQAIGARPVARWEAPMLYQTLEALCRRAGVDPVPHLCWVGEWFPVAFTIGAGEATTIALSEGLVRGMTTRELRGILAHEIVHVRNGDLALMQLALVVGQLTRTLSQIGFLLVFFSLLLRTIEAPRFPIAPLLFLAIAPLGVGLLQLALSRTIGFNISLPTEQEPNPYSTPELTFRFHYFAMRKMHLAMRANALGVFTGGFGTMDELFEILTLQQTHKAPPMPIVLFGRDYWHRIVDFDGLVEEGMIAAEDLALFSLADSPEEGWEAMLQHGLKAHTPPAAAI